MHYDEIIETLGLEAHPEGGYFRRTYTSPHTVRTPHGERAQATSIFYLMTQERPNGRLHRNRSDILHYFLGGGSLDYVLIDESGELRVERLDGEKNRVLLVPAGWWKAARLPKGVSHALVAEMVTPGFDFADHRFAVEADLAEFPQHLEALRPFLESS